MDQYHILTTVAELMELSARTAPKGGGWDYIVTRILTGDELEQLAAAMRELAASPQGKPFIARDAGNVENSAAVLLIGVNRAVPSGLNCGACGFPTCADYQAVYRKGPEFSGPVCAFRQLDLGIAIGSAARTAMEHNADNRVMYSAGSAAVRAGLMDADLAVGIPLSGLGKNIYFDRGE